MLRGKLVVLALAMLFVATAWSQMDSVSSAHRALRSTLKAQSDLSDRERQLLSELGSKSSQLSASSVDVSFANRRLNEDSVVAEPDIMLHFERTLEETYPPVYGTYGTYGTPGAYGTYSPYPEM